MKKVLLFLFVVPFLISGCDLVDYSGTWIGTYSDGEVIRNLTITITEGRDVLIGTGDFSTQSSYSVTGTINDPQFNATCIDEENQEFRLTGTFSGDNSAGGTYQHYFSGDPADTGTFSISKL